MLCKLTLTCKTSGMPLLNAVFCNSHQIQPKTESLKTSVVWSCSLQLKIHQFESDNWFQCCILNFTDWAFNWPRIRGRHTSRFSMLYYITLDRRREGLLAEHLTFHKSHLCYSDLFTSVTWKRTRLPPAAGDGEYVCVWGGISHCLTYFTFVLQQAH